MAGPALPVPTPRGHWIVGSITVANVVLLGVAVVLSVGRSSFSLVDVAFVVAGTVSSTAVGAIILRQRPGHGIGRLSLAIGTVFAIAAIFRAVAAIGDQAPGPIPSWAAAAAVLGSNLMNLAFLAGGLLMIVWFPDGRRTTRLGAIVEVIVALGIATTALLAVRPGTLDYEGISPAVNPFGLTWLDPALLDQVTNGLLSITFLGFVVAIVDIARRYRRGDALRRVQIRWVLASAGLTVTLMLATFFVVSELWSLWIASIVLTPIAIGIAITRYHLYEIDRIISRTIGYTAVTAVLFAAFVAVNLVLQNVIVRLTGNASPLTVAVSTLVVAVLFAPVRTRVQSAVDRRFHRARYDAEQTAIAFSERLRDQVDLPSLAGDLDATVRAVIAPSTLDLWLRGGG